MEDFDQINANLKDVSDQVKAFAEKADKEIKAHAQLSQETRENVDKLLTQQGELQARLLSAEQAIAMADRGGEVDQELSMGEQVAQSEGWQAFTSGAPRGSFSMKVNAAITRDTNGGGDLVVPTHVPGIKGPGQARLTVRDLLLWGRTNSNSVEFVRETGFTNAANVVSENPNSGKPESQLAFEAVAAPVVTIAHWIHASKQILSDAGMLQSYIDGRLRYGLKLKEEVQLLTGSGSGLNINGIATQASGYTSGGIFVSNGQQIDQLRLALLQVELADSYADGIIINPADWAAIELVKTTDGAYLFANPSSVGPASLWGRPVVTSTALSAGDFVVGAFGTGAQGWDREDVTVTVSLEDRDNFVKNMVTILCEERIALTVYRPEAFVEGSFGLSS